MTKMTKTEYFKEFCAWFTVGYVAATIFDIIKEVLNG